MTFDGNVATAGSGGGVYFNSLNASGYDFSLQESTLEDNEAYYSGGGAFVRYADAVEVSDCSFTENVANQGTSTSYGGGGLNLSYTQTHTVSRSTFCGNLGYAGGAVFGYVIGRGGVDDWQNNVFVENVSDANGGAVYLYSASSSTFENNHFLGNDAYTNGGAVYYRSSAPTFVNNLVAYTVDENSPYAADASTDANVGDPQQLVQQPDG